VSSAPWLSVVVPALDEAEGIATALLRLGPMRRRGVEVLVVDGGSGDATLERAAPHADRCLTAPRGRALQMNAGAEGARGEALLFLHADTLLPPDADRLVERALHSRGWGRFDVRLDARGAVLWAVERGMNLRSHLTGIATGDQAIFVRADWFRRAGGFPEIPLMEDVALSRALRRLGRPARIRTPVVTSARRWQRHGTLRTVALMWWLRWRYWRGESPESLAYDYARSCTDGIAERPC
jgi:rSAM/selenodomain-associated transferase 2